MDDNDDVQNVASQQTRDYVEHHSQPHLNDEKLPKLDAYTPSLLPPINTNVQPDREHVFNYSYTKGYISDIRVISKQQSNLGGQCLHPINNPQGTALNPCHKNSLWGVHQHGILLSCLNFCPTVIRCLLTIAQVWVTLQDILCTATFLSCLIKFDDHPESYWA